MAPSIWVAVPASRRGTVLRVIGNYRDQTHEDKKLLVVENGEAVGAYKGFPLVDKILQSDANPGAARNAALSWLREKHPYAYVVFMDDDDYYGPEYLTEHAERAERGVINGKRTGWVQFDTELAYFAGSTRKPASQTGMLGGTLGFYVSGPVPRFPEVSCGEDTSFCKEAAAGGMALKEMGPLNFCRCREGSPLSHSYRASKEKFWRRFGPKGVRVAGRWDEWVDKEPPAGPLETF